MDKFVFHIGCFNVWPDEKCEQLQYDCHNDMSDVGEHCKKTCELCCEDQWSKDWCEDPDRDCTDVVVRENCQFTCKACIDGKNQGLDRKTQLRIHFY